MGSLNTLKYEQGPLRKILDPWKRVSEMVFAGGGPGDQLDDVGPLAACFGRVLESNLRISSL